MALPERQPTSTLEKFLEGLKTIAKAQPGAGIQIHEDTFFVGSTEDPFVVDGMKKYLSGLGFEEDKERAMFFFHLEQKSPFPKRSSLK